MDYVSHLGWSLLLVLPVVAAPEIPPTASAALLGAASMSLVSAIADIIRLARSSP